MASRADPPAGAKGEVVIEELDRLQRVVARRSAESRATVPHLELEVEVGMESACRQASAGAAVARAVALALREHPRANGTYRDGHLERYSRVDLGVVIAGEAEYTIPTIFDAASKTLSEIEDELAALAGRAAQGRLSAPELSGATCTLWDAGALGLTRASPVIVPPQATALACGAVRTVPVIRDRAAVPAEVLTLSLACDHRILYGSAAAAFLHTIRQRLESSAL